MTTYLALLRGVNVGGKAMIKMSALAETLTAGGFTNVRTYIQSGNVIFESDNRDGDALAADIKMQIEQTHRITTEVVVFSHAEWAGIIAHAPKWWGQDKTWKHNLIVLIKPYSMTDVISEIGELKPEIESIEPGEGVLYQSMSFQRFGQTTSSKMIGRPIYKRVTIRNYNTATKLLALL